MYGYIPVTSDEEYSENETIIIVAHVMGQLEGQNLISLPFEDYEEIVKAIEKITHDWETDIDAEDYISAYARRVLQELFPIKKGR